MIVKKSEVRKMAKAFLIALGIITFIAAFFFSIVGLLIGHPAAPWVGGIMIIGVLTIFCYDVFKDKL